MTARWRVARLTGTATELHGRQVAWGERSVTWCDATAPAVVLGSTQPDAHVTAEARAVLEVARRRSGGGAVLVEPGRLVWADVVVPAGDALWHDDVARAAWWLGEAWRAALADLRVPAGRVHRSGLVRTPWSPWVCFAGLGPGEVAVEGRKAVGLSARRTRDGALFQCAVPLAWDPAPLLAALSLTPEERAAAGADLAGAVLPLAPVTAADVKAAFVANLP